VERHGGFAIQEPLLRAGKPIAWLETWCSKIHRLLLGTTDEKSNEKTRFKLDGEQAKCPKLQ